MKGLLAITVTGLLLLVRTSSALAIGYDDVAVSWPDGWSEYPGKSQGLKMSGPSNGAIALELSWGGTAAQNALKSAQRGGLKQVTKQQDIAFLGRAGYPAVGKNSALRVARVPGT